MTIYIPQAATNYAQSDASNLISDECPRNPENVRSETLCHGGQRDHEYPGGKSGDEDPEDSIDQGDRLNILTDPLFSVQIQCRKSLASTRLFAFKTQIVRERALSRLDGNFRRVHPPKKGFGSSVLDVFVPPKRSTSLDAATEFEYSFNKRPRQEFQDCRTVSATDSVKKISSRRLR